MPENVKRAAIVAAAAIAGWVWGYHCGWVDGYAEGLWDCAVSDPEVVVC